MKNSSFLSVVRWKSEAAMVRASARRTSSSDGPQYGQRRLSGLSTISPAVFVIEALDEFAGRVMDNSGVSTRLNLAQHLPDDGRFAATRIADDLEMLILGALRDT